VPTVAKIGSSTASGTRYDRRGRGRPVIFLHGWCLDRRMWMYAEAALIDRFDVITPDFAGFGKSADMAGPYSLDRYASDIESLIAEQDLRDVVLVGFAFGAAVALTLAARHNERVSGVVSVGAPGAEFSPYEKMPRAMLRDWPDFARRSAKALFHTPQSDATSAWLERLFASAALPVALETVRVLATFSPVGLASKVQVPQLFIHASQDDVAPVSIGQACAAGAVNAQLEVIEDCGHLIVLEKKDAFHNAVVRFLDSSRK
jgi:pimeloyl-ACP methyl ester carboxylesterase